MKLCSIGRVLNYCNSLLFRLLITRTNYSNPILHNSECHTTKLRKFWGKFFVKHALTLYSLNDLWNGINKHISVKKLYLIMQYFHRHGLYTNYT